MDGSTVSPSLPAGWPDFGPAEGARSLNEALARRATAHPGRMACLHLERGERPGAAADGALSYGALHERARGVAAALAARTRPGDRVLLVQLNEPSFVSTLWGCLLAGLVAVPAAVPRNPRQMERLRRLAAVAGARLAVDSPRVRPALLRLGRDRDGLDWLGADDLAGDPSAWADPGADPSTLAVLQFTSGSTGEPKGVMVSHGNVLHNARLLAAGCGAGPGLRIAAWLPFFHDWGLVGCLLFPIVAGGTVAYFDPSEFLQRPRRWLEAASMLRATTICAPNFAYEAAAAVAEEGGPLDLHALDLAMVGAEPVRPESLERFAAAYAPHGLRPEAMHPSYGLAESTLIVTGKPRLAPPTVLDIDRTSLEAGYAVPAGAAKGSARRLVGLGPALLDQRVRIAHPDTGAPVPEGAVGEVRVSGPSVAAGYWRRPAETARAFEARQAGERPWLRTGDLGFWMGGELFVCGRLKDVVIKAGLNHFAEDIEDSAAHAHPALRPGCGAAFGVEGPSGERLVVVHEVGFGPRPDGAEAIGAIQRAVALGHGVHADAIALLRPGTLEKTSSGKIRRGAARDAWLDGRLDPIALWEDPSSAALRPSPPTDG